VEQWEQLWQDLEQYKNPDPDEHFLGPLIVTPSEMTADTYDVIDGQQRLTTLQLIISIIRDSWIERGDESSFQSGIEVPNRALTSDLIHSVTPIVRYNFTPNRHLREIFREFVQIDWGQKSRKSFDDIDSFRTYKHADQGTELRRAWIFFKERIWGLPDVDLKQLEHYLLFKVLVLTIEAGESSNAYILFETLNYRGLELTQADLVKSYLFSKVFGEGEDEKFISLWDEIEALLGGKSIDTFLRHYLLLSNDKVLKKDIYSEIRSRFATKDQIIWFIQELRRNAHLYSYLVRETDFKGPHREVLNRLFGDLSKLGVDTQYVYLLAIMNKYFLSEDGWDYGKVENAARLSEVLSFRWTICGRNAQELEGVYQSAAAMIMDTKSPDDNFEQAQKLILRKLPSDPEFLMALSNKVIKSNQRGHYILRKIDQWHNREGAYVLMGPSELQLEHVAPRKPSQSSGWKKSLGEAGYSDLVSRIGNMILLKKKPNREGSNKAFRDKLEIYREQNKGKYPALSREVFDLKNWSVEVIEERSLRIAQLAVSVWSSESTDLQGKSTPRRRSRRSKSVKVVRRGSRKSKNLSKPTRAKPTKGKSPKRVSKSR